VARPLRRPVTGQRRTGPLGPCRQDPPKGGDAPKRLTARIPTYQRRTRAAPSRVFVVHFGRKALAHFGLSSAFWDASPE
jgi:hypothetical protein